MSDTTASLQRKLNSANDLQSVVRTMKTVAAASVGQYEASTRALAEYYHTLELGLGAVFRESKSNSFFSTPFKTNESKTISAIVFGSDQGLVGQFNDLIADHAFKALQSLKGDIQICAIGERVHSRLAEKGLKTLEVFTVPSTVSTIAPLVGKILITTEASKAAEEVFEMYLFYNRPTTGAGYEPVQQRLLPLDKNWQLNLMKLTWPIQDNHKNFPEILGSGRETMRALISEYLFVSLFRASAESLASENSSRLAAMQRADKNIEQLLNDLTGKFHRLRQNSIDEELFDVVSSFEALSKERHTKVGKHFAVDVTKMQSGII